MRLHVLPENPPHQTSVRVRPAQSRKRPSRVAREGQDSNLAFVNFGGNRISPRCTTVSINLSGLALNFIHSIGDNQRKTVLYKPSSEKRDFQQSLFILISQLIKHGWPYSPFYRV